MYRFYGKYNVPEEWNENFWENSYIVPLFADRGKYVKYLSLEYDNDNRVIEIDGLCNCEPNLKFVARLENSNDRVYLFKGMIYTLFCTVLPHQTCPNLDYHKNDINFIQNREIWGGGGLSYMEE